MKYFKKNVKSEDNYKSFETTDNSELIPEPYEKQKDDSNQKRLAALHKLVYFDGFKACRNADEVLNSYIKNTDPEVYLEESRLEYLRQYLFNNYLIKDEESAEGLSRILKEKISGGHKSGSQSFAASTPAEEIVGKKPVNSAKSKSQLYNELTEYLKEQISILQKKETRFDDDELFLSVFSNIRFGLQIIEQERFLYTLIKVMEDLDLVIKDTMSETEVKSYLKNRLLDVKNTEFWDEAEQRTRKCNVLLMGRYMRISSTDFMKAVSDSSDDPISVSYTAQSASGKHRIFINGTSFIADTPSKDRIIKYYEKINKEIIENANLKVNVLNEYMTIVSPELVEIIYDSLEAIPINVFLDLDSYTAFEKLLSSNSYLARQLLDSDAEQLTLIAENLKNDAELHSNICKIIDTSFLELCKIADKYINIPEEYHLPIVWILMRQSLVRYISELWTEEYGKCFDGFIMTNIDDYVDVYSRCADIPTKNIRPVGMFTYYLMGKNMFPADINSNFIKCCKFLIEKLLSKFSEVEAEISKDKLAKKQAAKEQAAKEQAAKEQAARELAAKEQAAKEQAAKEQAAKEQAAREQAARELAAKELAAKEQAAKEQAARELAAKEQAAREQAARELAAKELAAKEQAAKEQAAKEQAAKEQAAKEQAAKEQAGKEQAAKEQAAREQAAKELAAKEQAAREQAAKEQAAKEQAAKELAAKEQAAREQAAKEQAAKERAAREQAAREQAAKEQAAREQAAREQAAREQAARERAVKEQAAKAIINIGTRYSINDIDVMSGKEFEAFINVLFQKMGYITEIIEGSGNQMQDIIVERNATRFGIRAMCYSDKITNRDVQEMAMSLVRHKCSKGIAVSNSYFTDAAVKLTKSHNIVLWDRDILKKKLEEYFS